MPKLSLVAGTTGKELHIFLQNSASNTGAGLTGLTNASAGLTCYFIRPGDSAPTVVTLVNGTVGTYTSSMFQQINSTSMPGMYSFCPPNTSLNSIAGATSVCFFFTGATNLAPLPLEIELTKTDNQDGVHGGMTALPNTACATNGSLLTAGTGTAQVKLASGYVAMTWADIASNTTAQNFTNTVVGTVTSLTSVATGGIVAGSFAAGAINSVGIADGAIDAATFAAGAINSGAIATGAITNTKFAANSIDAPVLATGCIVNTTFAAGAIDAASIASSAIAAAKIATGAITNTKFAAGAIDAAAVADGAIDAATFAAGAINSAAVAANTFVNTTFTAGYYTAVENSVWDATAASHNTVNTTGAKLNAAGAAADPWGTAVPGAYSAGTAGYILGTNLDVKTSLINTTANAIKTKTDLLPASPANTDDIPSANTIADTTLRRHMNTVEGSGTGEALYLKSVYGLVQMLQETSIVGGTATTYQTDNSTSLGTRTVTTDNTATPVTGVR